jgi:hypothetical protein
VSLLDSSGRRIVVQDRSGAIEVLLPTGTSAPAVGTALRVTGTTGLAWGAPRIAATALDRVVNGGTIEPLALRRAPAERDEWLLIRLSGTVAKVSRIGERWKADLTLSDGSAALVQGQPGAGIPSTALVVGRAVTVTGIVRRPYPTASDRRFAVLPRASGDVALGSAGSAESGVGSVGGGVASGSTPGTPVGGAGGPANEAVITPDTDLATLGDAIGETVKVGGLIARIGEHGFDLDDGTALARVELRGDMEALMPHLRPGEAVAATGRVELVDGAPAVIVDDAGTLLRVGSLGEGLPIGDAAAPRTSEAPPGAAVTANSSGAFGPAPVSLLALASLTALSVLATVIRRRLVQRRLRLALVARLSGLKDGRTAVRVAAATLEASDGPRPAEHESA